MPTLRIAIGLLLFVPALLLAASVEKAKLLHANKLLEEAKKEAIAVVFSDATDNEKAEAMNLLGAIAVDEENYEAAIRNWSELVVKFPSTTAAKEAEAKLPLVRKLAGTRAAGGSAEPAVPSEEPGTVLVAGSAPEAPQYADQAVLEFMNFLMSNGVRAKNAFSGRLSDATGGRSAEVSLPNLLEVASKSGAASVLYVYIHFHGMENMRVECYAPDGRKLWQEKVAASMGLSPSGMTEGFVKRMKGKLERHVGDPCLPKSPPQE